MSPVRTTVRSRLRRLQQQALTGRRIAVPLVEVEHRPVGQRDVAEDGLLGDHRPRRRRRGELVAEPLLLHGTEHRSGGIGRLRAGRVDRQHDVAARLVGAELASVEEHHVGERPPRDGAVDDRVVGAGGTGDADRHVLPPCLVGGEAPSHELIGGRGILRRRPGIVVLHLVVVPDRQPRARRPRRLQMRRRRGRGRSAAGTPRS